MIYAVTIDYGPDKSLIDAHRPPHREYLRGLVEQGILVIAGPFTDNTGGFIVYDVDSEEKVEEVIKGDPFYKNGVFKTWTIRPWRLAIANPAKMP